MALRLESASALDVSSISCSSSAWGTATPPVFINLVEETEDTNMQASGPLKKDKITVKKEPKEEGNKSKSSKVNVRPGRTLKALAAHRLRTLKVKKAELEEELRKQDDELELALHRAQFEAETAATQQQVFREVQVKQEAA